MRSGDGLRYIIEDVREEEDRLVVKVLRFGYCSDCRALISEWVDYAVRNNVELSINYIPGL